MTDRMEQRSRSKAASVDNSLFQDIENGSAESGLDLDELAREGADQEPAVDDSGSTPGSMAMHRRNTQPGINPLDEVKWEQRSASIVNDKGEVIFEQNDVEVPEAWSQMATNVVVSKYFRGGTGMPDREHSVRQLIGRVVDTISAWGAEDGYFATPEDTECFRSELAYLLVNQHAAFNSPVWFNVGVEKKPQCSACFINSVEDSMESILSLARTEGMLFKYGSGTGSNLSAIRSSRERLSSGGYASGPVSFMRGFDAFAGVIKSGGKTRRAAKMVILDIEHPDIADFIECKVKEERKAWALIDGGYDGSFNGEAYSSIFFQNSNNSVRVSDEFMRAVIDDKLWTTRAVLDGEPMDTYRARDLMNKIAAGTHACGDPGMQFDTTINDWHTCRESGRINASNPCSEYMFLDNSACNLASLNLMKFCDQKGEFDQDFFRFAVRIVLIAQEILVDRSSYPRIEIENTSKRYRPLGLGYANLGAMLMARGLPYDSDGGRDFAAAVTALMCGQAYRTSAELARAKGTFVEYMRNRESFLDVIRKHRAAINNVNTKRVPEDLLSAVKDVWEDAFMTGRDYGYRNAQVTVLAPTGTIGFMMDCDTTGIEPDMALIKYKKLVDGGLLKIINHTVPGALRNLGYGKDDCTRIMSYLDENETIEDAPGLLEEHLPVFDCAFRPQNGKRCIHYMGHIRMMAAVQPFVSGAISKTVNMPNEVDIEDITTAYTEAWKMGLKAIAIYRDGSKRLQPLNTGQGKKDKKAKLLAPPEPHRVRLPDERKAITHKFSVGGHEGYLTIGLYPNGKPGEMFIAMAKEGSVVSGLMDSFATAVSIMLQYGVPLKVLTTKFSHTRFEPSGMTTNSEIPMAKSVMDYIFRWMELKFGDSKVHHEYVPSAEEQDEEAFGEIPRAALKAAAAAAGGADMTIDFGRKREKLVFETQSDSPPCTECGSVTVRNGACYKCLNCGGTSGCS